MSTVIIVDETGEPVETMSLEEYIVTRMATTTALLEEVRGSIAALKAQSATNQENTMTVLDDLEASVAVDTEVTSSAVTLLQGLSAQLEAAGTDPVKLAEIRDAINSNSQRLADAVTANTPAEVPSAPVTPDEDPAAPAADTPPADGADAEAPVVTEPVPAGGVPTEVPPADAVEGDPSDSGL